MSNLFIFIITYIISVVAGCHDNHINMNFQELPQASEEKLCLPQTISQTSQKTLFQPT